MSDAQSGKKLYLVDSEFLYFLADEDIDIFNEHATEITPEELKILKEDLNDKLPENDLALLFGSLFIHGKKLQVCKSYKEKTKIRKALLKRLDSMRA